MDSQDRIWRLRLYYISYLFDFAILLNCFIIYCGFVYTINYILGLLALILGIFIYSFQAVAGGVVPRERPVGTTRPLAEATRTSTSPLAAETRGTGTKASERYTQTTRTIQVTNHRLYSKFTCFSLRQLLFRIFFSEDHFMKPFIHISTNAFLQVKRFSYVFTRPFLQNFCRIFVC